MSYQVLARKWRPGSFKEMVGQEHVLQALVNALDNNRLHHAYLFTGTRGVGKTTIARILAKCLNCESGVSSTPCGECGACREIAEGRFVDLIEVDAASRTKVDDTRELLDNVQYAPTKGRYKVYLIDEVHMLSGHSFNALLKTLEEPPPHVKFLLATTDPQKLPVTVLSRCLQFNLKNLTSERIAKYLSLLLEKEQIPGEENALWALARSADGSMRDALSLTDQAIAHGNGKVTETDVTDMLGTINLSVIQDIALAIAAEDTAAVLGLVAKMAENAPDYQVALGDLLSLLHRVAVYQALPEATDNSHGDIGTVTELGNQLNRETVQLLYQIALLGRKDLPLAPEPRTGFEMVMLRMLAFMPQSGPAKEPVNKLPGNDENAHRAQTKESDPVKKSETVADGETVASDSLRAQTNSKQQPVTAIRTVQASFAEAEDPEKATPSETRPMPTSRLEGHSPSDTSMTVEQLKAFSQATTRIIPEPKPEIASDKADSGKPEQATHKQPGASTVVESKAPTTLSLSELDSQHYERQWVGIFNGLAIGGLLQNTAANLVLVEVRGDLLRFELDKDYSSLYDDMHQQRLAEALEAYFSTPVRVEIEIGIVEKETPQAYRERIQQERREAAILTLNSDPKVQMLKETFDAKLLENTVKPVEPE